MATIAINGTAGDDVLTAHSDSDYVAGQVVFVLGGMPSQGVWPRINILVNGSVVLANVLVDSDVIAGHTQIVTASLPAGAAITSVGIQYINDLVTDVDDRNVYVGSMAVNGVSLSLASATYVRDDRPTIAGSTEMNWNGTMTWSGAQLQSAASSGGVGNNAAMDGGAGMDTALYQGRASGYTVASTASGYNVTIKSGAFPTDTLQNMERVLFDDRAAYAYGTGFGATVDTSADTLDGGMGLDTLAIHGARSQFTITHTSTGFTIFNATMGSQWVTNVERLMFTDGMVALDINGDGGMAYRLYQAAFNRAPDLGGLGYQMTALDNGLGIAQVAANFIASPEFAATYGSLNNTQFVTQLYQNVLHRAPDSGGLAYHVNNLEHNGYARADVLVGFSESPENKAALIGAIQDGMNYTL
jgi:hypothetical protein